MFFAPEYQSELLLRLGDVGLSETVSLLSSDFFTPPYDKAAEEILSKLKDGKLSKGQIKQICQRHTVKVGAVSMDGEYSFDREEVIRYAKWAVLRDAFLRAQELKERGEYEKAVDCILQARDSFPAQEVTRRNLLDPNNTLPVRQNMIPTGLSNLDEWLDGGVGAGELAVILSSTSGGKSQWLVWVACNALKLGKKVAYVTLELPDSVIDARMRRCLLGQQDTPEGKVWEKYAKSLAQSGADLGIYFRAPGTITVSDLDRQLGNIDLLVIDYADYLASVHGKAVTEYQEVGPIYNDLKRIGAARKIPIWTASQAHRLSYDKDVHNTDNVEGALRKSMAATQIISLSQKEGELVPSADGSTTGTLYIAKNTLYKRGLKQPITMNFGTSHFMEGAWS